MPINLNLVFGYLDYLFSAGTKHSIHSPFIYDFATKVLNSSIQDHRFELIEQMRSKMLNSKALIALDDFGAVDQTHYSKKLSEIVKSASKQAKYARLLYRIIAYYQPKVLLELGTNVGISAMYQALSLTENQYLFSIEGSAKLAEIARHNIAKLGLNTNVQIVEGNFDDVLPKLLTKLTQLDFVFLDGNHRKSATIDYFEQLIPHINTQTIIVVDDINWSAGMQAAWHHIIDHEKTKVSIDLYFMGIVFFREELSKEHFTIRF